MYVPSNRWKSWVGCCVCALALLLAPSGCDEPEEEAATEEVEDGEENGEEAEGDGEEAEEDENGDEAGGPVGRRAEAHVEVAEIEIRRLMEMVNMYYITNSELPGELEALTDSANPLTDEIPEDPWGNEYVYEVEGEREFDIFSPGPDGEAGTDDDVMVE